MPLLILGVRVQGLTQPDHFSLKLSIHQPSTKGNQAMTTHYIPTTDALKPNEGLDSRDIIARIEDLEGADEENPLTEEAAKELEALKELADECEGYADWKYGEQLIREDYFVVHITELIKDCYEMPKEMETGKWPFNHMTMDYEAAAKEAEQDYAMVSFMGEDYFIRSC